MEYNIEHEQRVYWAENTGGYLTRPSEEIAKEKSLERLEEYLGLDTDSV
jgi:hypothetical protein